MLDNNVNEYAEMRRRHIQDVDNAPLGWAVGEVQFREMMEKWGLDAEKEQDLEKIIYLGDFAYTLCSDYPTIKEMFKRHRQEMKEAIEADKTGDGFILQMFYYELCNHEYSYTREYVDTLEALGYTEYEVMHNPALKHGLEKAITKIKGWEE